MNGPSPHAEPQLDVSIVIATYDRPESLKDTLLSCFAQTNALGLRLELLVLDNHPDQTARTTVEILARTAPWQLRYICELTRNMSVLRNRGFTEAYGRHVAIIDDDEIAAPDWIDQLVGALTAADADIAVGPRRATFAWGSPPAYDPQGRQFARDLHLPNGALLALTAPSGKPRYGLGTGNSLFRIDRCFPDGTSAMRLEFGDAGGEDAELFVRLHRQGRRIVWAARAIITETVLPHRTTVAYRLLRTRREAQHYVAIYTDGAPRPRLAWTILTAKGLIQCVVGAMIAAATLEYGSERRIAGRLLIAHGLGKLTARRPVGFITEPGGPAQEAKSPTSCRPSTAPIAGSN